MNCEIISVGTEILMGDTVNTNATYISNRLKDLGFFVYYHTVVGDNPGRLKNTIQTACDRSQMIILTGGLGPTQDDLTKECVCDFLKLDMVLHKESVDAIKSFFRDREIFRSEENLKQAYFPENAIILKNGVGTAPGCIIENEGRIFILLPGPPKEMSHMFEKEVIPYLSMFIDGTLYSRTLRFFGIGESDLVGRIKELIVNQTDPTIASYAKDYEVTLRVTSSGKNKEKCESLVLETEKKILEIVGEYYYGDGYTSLEMELHKLLKKYDLTISAAESCSGGLFASKIISIPGSSNFFLDGIVSYSNLSKISFLKVEKETLEKYGAVSAETAFQMAKNIRKISNTDIGISITGIAGPAGDNRNDNVGQVFIGIDYMRKMYCYEKNLIGDRIRIMNKAAMWAIFHAIKLINKENK